MSFLKRGRQFVLILSLFLLAEVDVWAAIIRSSRFNDDQQLIRSLSILDRCPKISLLNSEEEKYWYDRLWSFNKTLDENIVDLRREFLETCCDFSFRNLREIVPNIYIGKFDNGEDILFADKGVHIGVKSDLSKVLLLNSANEKRGVNVSLRTLMLPNIRPLCFRRWMKDKFKECIYKLSEDSVGCELLRVAVAKYKGSKGRLSKIKFIPVDNEKIELSCAVDCTVWKCLRKKQRKKFPKREGYFSDSNIIVFSPKWIKDDQPGFSIRIKEDSSEGEISVNTDIYPVEAGLLHHILYILHDDRRDIERETEVIKARSNTGYFYGYLPRIGLISTPGSKMSIDLLKNDEVFRIMFGITSYGIDMLNESAYLAHRYGWIRPAPVGIKTVFKFNGIEKNVTEFYDLLSNFLEFNADYGLYLYYLSSESAIEFPEFGKGAYRIKNSRMDKKEEGCLLDCLIK